MTLVLILIPILLIAASLFLRHCYYSLRRQRVTGESLSPVSPELLRHVQQQPEPARMKQTTADVTVVVTNLTDSVGLFERLGDLPAVEIINLYTGTMTPIIRRHGGFLNRLMGDRILFFFNPPMSKVADHPARAIETVLEMQTALDELNGKLEHTGKPPLKMRAGISSGMATVGDIGPAAASDYTVFGEAADRAAQLEQLCKQTGTRNLVSLETASRLGERFPLSPVKLSADAAPVIAYEVLQAKEKTP